MISWHLLVWISDFLYYFWCYWWEVNPGNVYKPKFTILKALKGIVSSRCSDHWFAFLCRLLDLSTCTSLSFLNLGLSMVWFLCYWWYFTPCNVHIAYQNSSYLCNIGNHVFSIKILPKQHFLTYYSGQI